MATAGSAHFELYCGSRGTAECRHCRSVQCCDGECSESLPHPQPTGPNHQLTHQHTEEPSPLMDQQC